MLIKQSSRKSVDLSDLYIGDDGLEFCLNFMMEKHICPEILNLRGNKLTAKAIAKLAAYIMNNDHLKMLNLEWNSINDFEDLLKFCDALERSGILYLDLKSNKMSNTCTDSIIRILQTNKKLLGLDLSWNEFTGQAAERIFEALVFNSTLVKLTLQGNKIEDSLLSKIETRITQNASDRRIEAEILKNLRTKQVELPEPSQTLTQTLTRELIVEAKAKETEFVKNNLYEILKEDLSREREINKNLSAKIEELMLSTTKERQVSEGFQAKSNN